MKKDILFALPPAMLIALGAGQVAWAMPNGLTSAVLADASIKVEQVAAKGGGMGGMAGGMGGGMGGGMDGGMASKGGMAQGGMAQGGMASKGGTASKGGMAGSASGKKTNVKNTNVKNTNIKNTNIRNTNVRNTNVNVVNRPVRVWAPRPYYGTVIAGVTLGTVVAASTVGVVPPPPGPNLCWFWQDSTMARGYWDYCTPP
jgi:hypothetical protein